jgi:hypothetical protein
MHQELGKVDLSLALFPMRMDARPGGWSSVSLPKPLPEFSSRVLGARPRSVQCHTASAHPEVYAIRENATNAWQASRLTAGTP